MIGDDFKSKGILKSVTDSSAIIVLMGNFSACLNSSTDFRPNSSMLNFRMAQKYLITIYLNNKEVIVVLKW